MDFTRVAEVFKNIITLKNRGVLWLIVGLIVGVAWLVVGVLDVAEVPFLGGAVAEVLDVVVGLLNVLATGCSP